MDTVVVNDDLKLGDVEEDDSLDNFFKKKDKKGKKKKSKKSETGLTTTTLHLYTAQMTDKTSFCFMYNSLAVKFIYQFMNTVKSL